MPFDTTRFDKIRQKFQRTQDKHKEFDQAVEHNPQHVTDSAFTDAVAQSLEVMPDSVQAQAREELGLTGAATNIMALIRVKRKLKSLVRKKREAKEKEKKAQCNKLSDKCEAFEHYKGQCQTVASSMCSWECPMSAPLLEEYGKLLDRSRPTVRRKRVSGVEFRRRANPHRPERRRRGGAETTVLVVD